MKRIKIGFACLLLCLLSFNSQALAIDLYGFGSYWEKGDVDGTWGAGVGVSLPIITQHLRLDGRAHFFEDSDYGTGTITVIPFDLGAQIHFVPNETFDPYIMAGLSYNYIDGDDIDLDSKFGGYLGGGVDIELGSPLFKLFGELFYRYSDIDIDDIEIDELDASGFTGNIGLKFHF